MDLRKEVAEALACLEVAGHTVYLVGGCVRDALLGKTPTDFDLCTSAKPEEVCRIFAAYRVIETGLRHGTVTVLIDGLPLEITTYRKETGYTDGRRPDHVDFHASLHEDLMRRDFTINAMAYHPREGVIDCFGGKEDLQAGIIRCVGEAKVRFSEDALRILRALRFAATQDFSIEASTEQAIREEKQRLRGLAAERVRVELEKLLCGKAAARVLLDYINVLGEVLPELLPMRGFAQPNRYHCHDVLTHTVLALTHAPAEPILRWTLLLHDSGKPDCFSIDASGEAHFYGHAERSAALASEVLQRLRFDRAGREKIVELVRLHDMPLPTDERQLRRQLSRRGAIFFDWLAVKRADCCGQASEVQYRLADLSKVEEKARELLEKEGKLDLHTLALSGGDLLALGLQGPAIGAAQRRLLEAVLDGRVPNEREALLHFLSQIAASDEPIKCKF